MRDDDTPAETDPIDSIEHYDNGQVKLAGSMLAGEMHGDWVWYRRDGSLMRTGAFDRGRQIGPWRTFDRTGRLVKETSFPDAG